MNKYTYFWRRHRLQDSWTLSRRRLVLKAERPWLVAEEAIGDLFVIEDLDVSFVPDDMMNVWHAASMIFVVQWKWDAFSPVDVVWSRLVHMISYLSRRQRSGFDAAYVRRGAIGSKENRLDGNVALAEKLAITHELAQWT